MLCSPIIYLQHIKYYNDKYIVMLTKTCAVRYRPSICFVTSYFSADKISTVVSVGGQWLASSLREHDIPFMFFKEPFNKIKPAKLRKELLRLRKRNVKIIGISLYGLDFDKAKANIEYIRRVLPDVWIVAGGPTVNSADMKDLAQVLPEVDCFVKGDSERAFSRLARMLLNMNRYDVLTKRQEMAISRLKGVYFKHFDFVHHNGRPNVISKKHFNGLQLLWDIQELREDIKEHGYLSLNTRRGCKYRCIFCSHQFRKKPVAWTAPKIVRELKRIKGLIEAGVLPKEAASVAFCDDDFFQDPIRAKKFLRMIIEDEALNNYFSFVFESSLPSFLNKDKEVDFDLMELLSQLKQRRVLLGTDSFSDDELRYFVKNHYGVKEIEKVVEAFEEYKILNAHFVILTSYGSTTKSILDNINKMLDLCKRYPNYFRIKISNFGLILQSGSALDKLASKGKIPGIKIYFYVFGEQHCGLIISEDPLVGEFLNGVTQVKYSFDEDINEYREALKSGKLKPDNRMLIRFIIDTLERMKLQRGSDTFYIEHLTPHIDHALNVFVLQKLLYILLNVDPSLVRK